VREHGPNLEDPEVIRTTEALLTELNLLEVDSLVAILAMARALGTLMGVSYCPACIGSAAGGFTALMLQQALDSSHQLERDGGFDGGCHLPGP
jgi:hypothetical protein